MGEQPPPPLPAPVREDRPISAREAALVKWMLTECSDHPELADTVPNLHVVSRCPCGCASVNFVEGTLGGPLADAMGTTREGLRFGLILFARGEAPAIEVTSLEIYECDEGSSTELQDSFDLLTAIPSPRRAR